MKFKIRFADQIVGILIIVALASIVVAIIALGTNQRWFARNYLYKTYFDQGTGLGENMPVLYKGFTIGNVKSFRLTELDEVEVIFSIYDIYNDRVKEGSLIRLDVSPVGLGNQFIFYSGLGEPLEEGSFIPVIDSPDGQQLIGQKLAQVPAANDSISNLISQVSVLLTDVDTTLLQVQNALNGENETVLGRTMIELNETVAGVNTLIADVNQSLPPILNSVNQSLASLEKMVSQFAAPDGFVSTVLDTNGSVFTNLNASLKSVAGTLENLEKMSTYFPKEMPQIEGLLHEVRGTLKSAEDVLTGLSNNPLIKNGIPDKVQTQSSGTSPRDIEF
ncbi:MAG: MlaD family protein [Treponema sp.]|jgi:phospholipid/cholesterol/gamma-HCH transport system substrate-binding protein|nr:MlaD family protein [Treponema sp.]